MIATATAVSKATEHEEQVEVTEKPKRYTAVQIEEVRQRVQANGKVIAPVLKSLAELMFHHEISNRCILGGLRDAVCVGMARDVNECRRKWGMDQNLLTFAECEEEGGLELVREFDGIWRGALADAFVDWSFSQGVDG